MFVKALLASSLLLAVGSAPLAQAQEAVAAEEVPRAQQIHAVERGLFIEADVGLGYVLGEIEDRKYGLGMGVAVAIGYDIAPVFQISLGLNAYATGQSDAWSQPRPIYDLLYMGPMLRAQLALLTTERNFFSIRGEVGYAFGRPSDHVDDGLNFGGALVFERFTMLRHFSWGIAAGVSVFTEPSTLLSITLTPQVKYTF